MNELVALHLKRAERFLVEANFTLTNEFFDAAINRSYYAMFHAVTAVLKTEDVARSSHAGVIAAFNQFFVKPGKFTEVEGRWLKHGFETRNKNDYWPAPENSEAEALQLFEEAKAFVAKCREYCEGA
ncbi:MAG: HEPN domain-containing protein [bacterium]|nr:HEPN domain-containing protein [bacterium]